MRHVLNRLWLEPRWASLQVSSWEPHQFRLLVFYGRGQTKIISSFWVMVIDGASEAGTARTEPAADG